MLKVRRLVFMQLMAKHKGKKFTKIIKDNDVIYQELEEKKSDTSNCDCDCDLETKSNKITSSHGPAL